MEGFIPYSESNNAIIRAYNKENYKIKYNSSNSNFCYVYFSSNGLYIKDDNDSFEDIINKKNRYEWENLSPEIRPEKEIFIRDIWLSWYVKGINNTISDISKLISFLKKETEGYRVITVGVSSGGYIASIVATKLNAYMCFNISGQFSLKNHNNHVNLNPLLHKYKNERGLYYESYLFIKNSNVPIIYMYPNGVEHDVEQARFVNNFKNVYSFCFNSNIHAKTVLSVNYPKLLSMDRDDIIELHKKCKGKVINKFIFSFRLIGIVKTCKYFIEKLIFIFYKRSHNN